MEETWDWIRFFKAFGITFSLTVIIGIVREVIRDRIKKDR